MYNNNGYLCIIFGGGVAMYTRVGLLILCVDDERSGIINCKAAIEGFQNYSSAQYFQKASEAIDYVRANAVDISFLDIDMPDMTGFELAKVLKSHCATIKIVYLTADIQYMSCAKRQKDAFYIFKPYAKDEIIAVLEGVEEARSCDKECT